MPPKPPAENTLNIELLERLRGAAGNYVSLDRLGCDLGRLGEDLDALVRFGFVIERHPYLGAAFRGPSRRLCPDQIEYGLGSRRIGRRIAVWSRASSTNDLAARAGSNRANDGLVVLAEEQVSGRGRRGRSWLAPAESSILMSILLFPPSRLAPPLGPEAAFGCAWLTALAAVATAEVVSSRCGCEARIKWPNDIRIDGRKTAGILVERVLGPPSSIAPGEFAAGVVLGIGLNVNVEADVLPEEIRDSATSMRMLAGTTFDRSELARDLIKRLDTWYDHVLTVGAGVLNAPWRDLSEHLGRMVSLRTSGDYFHGRLIDLDLQHGPTLDLDVDPPCRPDPARPSISTSRRLRIPVGDVLSLDSCMR